MVLKEFEMKICKKVIFGLFWKKLIFGNFDLRGVFWELRRIPAFLEMAISEKIVADFVWPSKRSQQGAVQKSYFD